jgi:predicted metal-dependent peptidase
LDNNYEDDEMFALDMMLTPEQRVNREITKVLDHDRYAAMAGVAQLGEIRVERGVPTAYTNFRDIVIGYEFVETLTDEEIRGVFIHELYHIIYMHAAVYLWMHKTNPKLANVVWDYRINGQIVAENRVDGFAKLPDGALYDSKYDGMLEGDIWELLYKEEEEGGAGGDTTSPTDDEGRAGSAGSAEQGSMDDHDVEAFEKLSEEEQRELSNDIQEAIRQGLLAAEKAGKGGNKTLEELVEVVIPWEDIIQEWFVDTCSGGEDGTFRVPNRKYMPINIIRPSRIQDKLNDIVLAIDTSGSVASEQLTKFMSVVRNIIETLAINNVHVIYWDTEVRSHEVYGETAIPLSELVNTTKPKGGGGTDVTCVHKYIEQNNIQAEGVVVLTDGHLWGGWGTWTMPVLWAVLNNREVKPSVGKKLDVLI